MEEGLTKTIMDDKGELMIGGTNEGKLLLFETKKFSNSSLSFSSSPSSPTKDLILDGKEDKEDDDEYQEDDLQFSSSLSDSSSLQIRQNKVLKKKNYSELIAHSDSLSALHFLPNSLDAVKKNIILHFFLCFLFFFFFFG